MKTISTNQLQLFPAGFPGASIPASTSKPTGKELKETGQDSVLNNEDEGYIARFYAFVRTFESGFEFSSDNVVAVIGMPEVHCNSLGSLMSALGSKGLATRTSRRIKSTRPSAHYREISVWKRL